MNNLFNSDQRDGPAHIDIQEYDDRVTVVADLPGVRQTDINLHCDGHTLSIRATSEARSHDERVDLPVRVDEESATATYNNGVLEITFDRADDPQIVEGSDREDDQ